FPVYVVEQREPHGADVGVALAALIEQACRVRQFGAAKERDAEMMFARAEPAHQLAAGETKHVPFDGFGKVRLPGQNPFAKLVRHGPREFRAGFHPLDGVFGARAATIHFAGGYGEAKLRRPESELSQEPDVIFVEQPDIINAVTEHGDAFDAESK